MFQLHQTGLLRADTFSDQPSNESSKRAADVLGLAVYQEIERACTAAANLHQGGYDKRSHFEGDDNKGYYLRNGQQ